MSVSHFVLHSFGSWHPDHPKGWHLHGLGRPLETNPGIGRYRRRQQKQPTVYFSDEEQYQLIERVLDVCNRRCWRCHAIGTSPTHVHSVLSWKPVFFPATVQATCKRLLGLRLAEVRSERDKKYFSRGGEPEPVANRAHLAYLVHEYIPRQAVWFWSEGDGAPRRMGGEAASS